MTNQIGCVVHSLIRCHSPHLLRWTIKHLFKIIPKVVVLAPFLALVIASVTRGDSFDAIACAHYNLCD